MANQVSTQVREAPRDAISGFKQELMLREQMLKPLLPSTVSFDKFTSTVVAAIANTPKLIECTRASLMKASIEAAELGLSLNPALKEADILPVWNGRLSKYEAQMRPRYMGLMKLARQSGQIKNIYAHVVHDKDLFDYDYGLDKRLIHKPSREADPGKPIAAYCVWEFTDGTKDFEVMTAAQIDDIKKRSSSKNKQGEIVGPWKSDPEEMWRKTVVKRATKYMPQATDFFAAASALDNAREGGEPVTLTEDGHVIREDGGSYETDITDVSQQEGRAENKPSTAGRRKGTKANAKLDALEGAAGGDTTSGPVIDNVIDNDEPPPPSEADYGDGDVTAAGGDGADGDDAETPWVDGALAAVKMLKTAAQAKAWIDQNRGALANAAFEAPDAVAQIQTHLNALMKAQPAR